MRKIILTMNEEVKYSTIKKLVETNGNKKIVFNNLNFSVAGSTIQKFNEVLKDNKSITFKEKQLWEYVVTTYANCQFSTKELEKDFGNAAYATIHTCVNKFEKL